MQKYIKSFETLCKDAIETHNFSLLEMPMSKPEYEKQQRWLVCTMKENNEFVTDVKQWLSDAGVSYNDGGDDGMSITDTNINPDDSLSNAPKKGSQVLQGFQVLHILVLKLRLKGQPCCNL